MQNVVKKERTCLAKLSDQVVSSSNLSLTLVNKHDY